MSRDYWLSAPPEGWTMTEMNARCAIADALEAHRRDAEIADRWKALHNTGMPTSLFNELLSNVASYRNDSRIIATTLHFNATPLEEWINAAGLTKPDDCVTLNKPCTTCVFGPKNRGWGQPCSGCNQTTHHRHTTAKP